MKLNTRKKLRGALSALLCLALLAAGPAAFAENAASEKEEVVYATTDAGGGVNGVYVVNIFGKGDITDYGEYTDVKMLTSTEEITQNGDEITFGTDADRVYYQGTLDAAQLPWNVSITYTLDGKTMKPEIVAGQSGHLVIHVGISQNKSYSGPDFYGSYALQASFTFDTLKCTGITAENATMTNVGGNKQLSYTALPGKGLDASIEMDVTDFEMDAAAINAVPLSLNISVDTSEITEKTDELKNGVADLDSGAKTLADGAAELNSGASSLQNAVTGSLASGAANLSSGIATLSNGLDTLSGKNTELVNGAYSAFSGLCTAAQAQINTQLAANGLQNVTLTPETYQTVLQNILATLGGTAYSQIEAQVRAQVTQAVNAQVRQTIQAQAQEIYIKYILSQTDDAAKQMIYSMAAAQAVSAQYLQAVPNATQDEVNAYLASEAGQQAIQAVLAAMTDEQKQAALNAAASQKAAALTDDEKQAIIDGAVEQTMQSSEVQAQIESRVASEMVNNADVQAKLAEVNTALGAVASLKAQLDSYNTFYSGLQSYTAGVATAANGAQNAKDGAQKLYASVTGDLSSGVSTLQSGTSSLASGAVQLKDGTGELRDKTSDIDTQIEDKVNDTISSLTGSGEVPGSFVSSKNTNVKSVQFVIKTSAISIPEQAAQQQTQTEAATVWQRLKALFK